jgi:hypothetical protein
MAKLSVVYPNVEVEVNGQKYRKVERKAQAGDIVKALTDRNIDVDKGAFYSVIDEGGETGFYDNDEDFRHTGLRLHPERFEVYEKVTEPAAVEYREVNRKAEKGERIRIVNACDPRYSNGDEFVVEKSEPSDVMAYVKHPEGTSNGCAGVLKSEYVVLEPVNNAKPAEPTPQKRLTVGDYAKVIANNCAHNYVVGSVVKITEDDADRQPYKAKRADGTIGNWMQEGDVEPATEAEFNAQKRLKVGEYAKVVQTNHGRYGQIVKVTQNDRASVGGYIYATETLDGRSADIHNIDQLVRATESEVEAAEKSAERAKQIGEFADGGYAEIACPTGSNANYGAIESAGAYVKVSVTDGYRKLALYDAKGEHVGWCNADALRKVTREEYEEATMPRLNVGDLARTLVGKDVPKGAIVRITRVDRGVLPYRGELLDGSEYEWYRPEQLEKVSAEEVARIGEEAEWNTIGRKVGEYKRGDVVSFVKDGGKKTGVGTVEDSAGVGSAIGVRLSGAVYEGTYEGVFFDNGDTAKLIVPVEQRFDRSEGGASSSK